MLEQIGNLPTGKIIYFASDFHLGAPDKNSSDAREAKIVKWLEESRKDAAAIILAGDIFDFWFEYRRSIPRGFVRLQGKIAEITDSGIPVIFFTGNHDMWMFDYFQKEIGVIIYCDPQIIQMNDKKLLVGHGDGLGPGDFNYKILKRIFGNKFCQWAFARLHPNFGIGLANYWSSKSRISSEKGVEEFDEETDFLLNYCLSKENEEHFDYYIFGHRHIPIKKKIGDESWYINLGEWVNSAHYGRFDGHTVELIPYK